MADVRILPEIISNRIAAGEVVERPVSVVKELMENALDANASRIAVEIKNGGRALIRVSDNGDGMSRDNALLATERYATSKIFDDEDLFSIKSLGFRGEALPSIASISKFTITTCEKGSNVGTRIQINGGKILDVSDIGTAPGTIMEVRDLFFNTPARRKFLKTVNTEMGHIADAFSAMSLGYSGIQFRLIHNNRVVRHFATSDDLKTRAGLILGSESLEQLYPVHANRNGIHVSGYITDPRLSRSSPQKIQLFVNGRMVTDRGIISAIQKGYTGRLMKGRYPLAILFVSLPFDQVDVNVHPAKLQVRFANHKQIFSIVADGVLAALQKGQLYRNQNFSPNSTSSDAPSKNPLQPTRTDLHDEDFIALKDSSDRHETEPHTKPPPEPPQPEANHSSLKIQSAAKNIKKDPGQDSSLKKPPAALFKWGHTPAVTDSGGQKPDKRHSKINFTEPFAEKPDAVKNQDDIYFPNKSHETEKKTSVKENALEPSPVDHDGILNHKQQLSANHSGIDTLSVLGQTLGTYIIAESSRGLVIIDQHAAHERIVYEQLKKRSDKFRPPSQELVIPEVVELSFKEAELMERIAPELRELGIKVEPFGGTTYVVKSVPAIIDDRSVKPMVLEILDTIENSGIEDGDEIHHKAWLEECLILMACHSAIRANRALSAKEMEILITDLGKCDNPFHCPHGRPTLIEWDERGLEKLFKRSL